MNAATRPNEPAQSALPRGRLWPPLLPIFAAALLPLCAGCSPIRDRHHVDRRVLDARPLDDVGVEPPRFRGTLEVEAPDPSAPVALIGRMIQVDVCRTLEHQHVEEVDVTSHELEYPPGPRAVAGAFAAAGAAGFGFATGRVDAGTPRDTMLLLGVLSGIAAVGLLGSAAVDWARANDTKGSPVVREATAVAKRWPCNPRPSANLTLTLDLISRWGKRVDVCATRDVSTDGAGRFRIAFDELREMAKPCRGAWGESTKELEVTFQGNELQLPATAREAVRKALNPR